MTRPCAREGCPNDAKTHPRAIYCSNACKIAACKQRRRAVDAVTLTDAGKRFPGVRGAQRRVLLALAAAGGRGATTAELCQPAVGGVRFGGRVHELRERGFKIEQAYDGHPGRHRYWLVALPGEERLVDVRAGVEAAAIRRLQNTRVWDRMAGR